MTIKMKTIMSNSVTRFFFRFVKKVNIILSTGKVLDFERQSEMCCIVREENLSEVEEQEMLQLMLI